MAMIRDDELWELGVKIRNRDDRFTGEDSPASVLKQVAVDRYAELAGDEQAAERKREELRSNLLGGREPDVGGTQDDTKAASVKSEQARLRRFILQ